MITIVNYSASLIWLREAHFRSCEMTHPAADYKSKYPHLGADLSFISLLQFLLQTNSFTTFMRDEEKKIEIPSNEYMVEYNILSADPNSIFQLNAINFVRRCLI